MAKKNWHLSEHCPRGLEAYPAEPCEIAIRSLEAARNGQPDDVPGMCPWYCPDAQSNYCVWSLIDRESPVEDTKEIAKLLGMSKKEVEDSLKSAFQKLKNLGEDSRLIRSYLEEVENCSRQLDDSIYLQLMDADDEFDPEDVSEDYKSTDLDDFKLAGQAVPNKRRETVKHHMRGTSGAGAIHHSGKVQLYGLSPKWGKDCRKWAEQGTPIKLAQWDLKRIDPKGPKVNKNVMKRIAAHAKFVKEHEMKAAHGYELVLSKLIDSIVAQLKVERLAKSDVPDVPPVAHIEIDVMGRIQETIEKHLEALRYILLGTAAGEEAAQAVEKLRLKTKLPNGSVIQAYLDATDTHRDHYSDLQGTTAPDMNDQIRKRTLDFIKERCGRHVDQSVTELRNRLMANLETALQEAANEQHKAAKQAALEKLQSQDLNAKERKKMIKDVLEEATKERMSLTKARQILKDSTKDYATNWDRIVKTEMGMASNTATAQTIQETAGKVEADPIVVIATKHDDRVDDICISGSYHKDGEYRYFRLSSLKPPGYNLGRKKKDWVGESIPLRHVGCRCVLLWIPSGYKVTTEGSLVKLKEGETLRIE
jgi:hypothetical protein